MDVSNRSASASSSSRRRALETRVPARALVIFSFAIAPLAAYGLDTLRRRSSHWLNRTILTLTAIGAILFVLGIFAMLYRRNVIAVLMGVELILNAANINFIAFSRYGGVNISGQMASIFVIVIAAGLGIAAGGW